MADTWPNIGGGQAYCFEKMTSQIYIVLEQKTIVFQNIGGPPPPPRPPKCPPLVKVLKEVHFFCHVTRHTGTYWHPLFASSTILLHMEALKIYFASKL